MLNRRLLAVAVIGVMMTACASSGVDRLAEDQCPAVDVLATADKLARDNVQAQLLSAKLDCFIDHDESALLAQVTLSGRVTASGIELPMFVAALAQNGTIIARTQFKTTPSENDFNYTLPRITYGEGGGETRKARLVVGFVLTAQQLADNRAGYRKKLGLE